MSDKRFNIEAPQLYRVIRNLGIMILGRAIKDGRSLNEDSIKAIVKEYSLNFSDDQCLMLSQKCASGKHKDISLIPLMTRNPDVAPDDEVEEQK